MIDLRTDVEVELEGPGPITRAPQVRIEHRSLYPSSGGNTDLEAATVKPWGDLGPDDFPEERPVVRTYMNYLAARPDSIVGALRAIASADGAVLVHCAAGKDRTGVVVALALDAVGVDRGAIVADYVATAERIVEILERLVSSPTYRDELEGHDPQQHAPVARTMERVLELVDERFGGAERWLVGARTGCRPSSCSCSNGSSRSYRLRRVPFFGHKSRREREWDEVRASAQEDLVALGDDIRALDIDISMPGCPGGSEAALRAGAPGLPAGE